MAIARQIVDRLHVSTSDIGVIKYVNSRFKKNVRFDRFYRDARHATYREALKIHHDNQELYYTVMRGL